MISPQILYGKKMKIRYIENVAKMDVAAGLHHDMGENAMLIQISDPASYFPTPKYKFKQIHQFEFLDAEDDDDFDEDAKFSDEQAKQIIQLLHIALENNMNVLVHCHAGICRSGAVVEVASMIGFTPTDKFRQPNIRVKHKLMKQLGLTYDSTETYDEDYWKKFFI